MVSIFACLFPKKWNQNNDDLPTFIGDDEPWYNQHTFMISLDSPVVNLDNKHLGDDGVIHITQHLSPSSCRVLYLSRNRIGPRGAHALASSLLQEQSGSSSSSHRCLTVLCLSMNALGVHGVRALAHNNGRRSAVLTELLLDTNMLGDAGAEVVSDVLLLETYPALRRLDLGNNGIGDVGATALAMALGGGCCLRKLTLWGNEIGAVGAGALARALTTNETLEELCLLRNQIGDEGAQKFAKSLETNRQLQSLLLSNNGISDDSAGPFALALLRNHTLRTLDLRGNQFMDSGKEEVRSSTRYNVTAVANYLVCEPECSLPDLLAAMAYNSTLNQLKVDSQDS